MKSRTLLRDMLPGVLLTVVGAMLSIHPLNAATFQGIGDLPGGAFESIVEAVSADGFTAAGRSQNASGFQPIRWDDDRNIHAIEEGSYAFASAGSVSVDGRVIVMRLDNKGGLWTEETGFMNLTSINPGAISADGLAAAGSTRFGVGAEVALWTSSDGSQSLGRLRSAHSMAAAEDIAGDELVIVGVSCGPCEAFRWTEATGMIGLGDLTGGAVRNSWAHGISADGNVIVGTATLPNGSSQAFRWTAQEGMQGLGVAEGSFATQSQANAANVDGSVVVGFIADNLFGSDSGEAFIWDDEQGMRLLEQVLVEDYDLGSALDGWTLTVATDISNDGLTIVGNGMNPRGQREGWVARLDHAADCNGDGLIDAGDLACVTAISQRDEVLGALNTVAGDLDGNGRVDFADFLIVATNFGDPGNAKYTDGDIDLMEGPQFADFAILSSAFGFDNSARAAAAVPEPSACMLLALCGLVCSIRRATQCQG